MTYDSKQAVAHFGDRDDAEEFKPICKWWDRMSAGERIEEMQQLLADLNAERDDNDSEQLRVQLAGCLTAADGATKNPALKGDYGWSVAYQAVLDLHARASLAEAQREELLKALEPVPKFLFSQTGFDDSQKEQTECRKTIEALIQKHRSQV